VSITAIDFKNVTPETLVDFLKLFGFNRYVNRQWLIIRKGQDERYPCKDDGSPDGLYTGMIVPEQYYDKDMFVIPKEYLERILVALKENSR
jgi:hypothetical protein